MQTTTGAILHHGNPAGALLTEQGHVAAVPAQRGRTVGGEPPQARQGNAAAGGLLLQQEGGCAVLLHQAGQPLAIAAQGRILAIRLLAQPSSRPSGSACQPQGAAAAPAEEGQEGQGNQRGKRVAGNGCASYTLTFSSPEGW